MKLQSIIIIIGIVLLTGCNTTNKIPSGKPEASSNAVTSASLRGYALLPESYMSDDPELLRKNIDNQIRKAAEARYGTIFFFMNDRVDLLAETIASAHSNRLRIFPVLNLSAFSEEDKSLSDPAGKTMLRNKIQGLVMNFSIDGLGIIAAEQPKELVDLITAESMVVKPYLVSSLLFNSDKERRFAEECRKDGIVDMIVPIAEIKKDKLVPFASEAKQKGSLKNIQPEQAVELDLSALFPSGKSGQNVILKRDNKSVATDSEGRICFITSFPDTILLGTSAGDITLVSKNWSLPYIYSVQPDGSVMRKAPWVEFRSAPIGRTNNPEFELLCKTVYPASVAINGDSVKQYRTGIFFKKISLEPGRNIVRAAVVTPDSLTALYEKEIFYEKTEPNKQFPLWIDEKSIEPLYDMMLLPDDVVRVSFRGSLGQDAWVTSTSENIRIKCSREDRDGFSLYRAELPFAMLSPGKSCKLILKIATAAGSKDKQVYESRLTNLIKAAKLDSFPLVRVKNRSSRLIYNLGAPRLGGPIRSELDPGIILKTNGKLGDNYRIRLSRSENGFIHQDDVELMPEGTVTPSYSINIMECKPASGTDVLSIPYLEPVPYEVYPDPDHNRIVITLFGVETSSTWIAHNAGLKIIDKITWQQTTPETYQVYINLKTNKIWGYDLRVDGKKLVLGVKYPPVYDLSSKKPLAGLKIAIEAGHGGILTGAIGLSGLVEKDIDLDLSIMLGDLLKSMGAGIVQIRDSDWDIPLLERRRIAIASGANLFISIHANAGGGGYLFKAGTSTYYHNPFWAPLAEAVYDRLLQLGLKEFGVVGSFNYTVTRVSQMPAILVEQAFMTHAEDEEKLADPTFRRQMAQKIYEGIVEYLKYMSLQ